LISRTKNAGIIGSFLLFVFSFVCLLAALFASIVL
jgi:hypothetical protein